ncbi:hypothetical protein CYMTET_34740, partial [Cymbomonas tetramitiformis]
GETYQMFTDPSFESTIIQSYEGTPNLLWNYTRGTLLGSVMCGFQPGVTLLRGENVYSAPNLSLTFWITVTVLQPPPPPPPLPQPPPPLLPPLLPPPLPPLPTPPRPAAFTAATATTCSSSFVPSGPFSIEAVDGASAGLAWQFATWEALYASSLCGFLRGAPTHLQTRAEYSVDVDPQGRLWNITIAVVDPSPHQPTSPRLHHLHPHCRRHLPLVAEPALVPLQYDEDEDEELYTAPVDTAAPTITLNGAAYVEVTQRQVYTDPGAVANDVVDGNVPVDVEGLEAVDTTSPTPEGQPYVLTYTAHDASNNTANPVQRQVRV